ncbi:MAG TPA: hypothetical protein VKA38_12080 [Draconibacterium sp.]|nr:hypothetical protein [Draconibacterium sp.]
MKWYKLFFFVIIVIGFNACTQKPSGMQDNVKYFRNIQFSETPWDLEKGTHPLSADEAKTINNYKFTYNDKNQLVSVEYNRNGILLGYSSLGAAKITYTYDGNKQVKHFFNEKGESVESGGAFAYEYTLNDSGMRVAMQFVDKNGQPIENRNKIHNYKWKKLPDGLIQELRYNRAGDEVVMNPFCPFYELRFSYNEKGYPVRMANYEADTLYNCTAENCGDIGVSYFLFENNDQGDLKKFSVHNTIGQLSNLYFGWAKRVNEVDGNGYIVQTTMYDQDDEYVAGQNVPVTQSVYDEHGALVKRISMDGDKNIVNNPGNGVAITEYKYDDQGRRTETLRYDKDGNLVKS